MAAIRTALVDWRKYLVGVFTQVLGNPVIGRELRVRVRVGRAYMLQAFYLAFLILIVALAYQAAIGDNPDLRNPVRVQEALVGFYRIVMSMLVARNAPVGATLIVRPLEAEHQEVLRVEFALGGEEEGVRNRAQHQPAARNQQVRFQQLGERHSAQQHAHRAHRQR